jgi:hypothetical protein
MDQQNPPKAERFAEFVRRLGAAPAASSFDEAYSQVCDILNGVENEMTSIPFDPSRWMEDGRMYPPQMDHAFFAVGHPGVIRFRSRHHNTFIGKNGAIEIRTDAVVVILSKSGSDGRSVFDGGSDDEPN